LLDAAGRTKVGEFYASCACAAAPFGPGPLAAANLEYHTLTLEGGTIVGIGTAVGAENVYAIVGGTGRYAGASGTYEARQSPLELGGDGTAVFTLGILV
jgi:hypothetical protein